MKTFLSIVQIILSIALIGLVILQPRKQSRGSSLFGGTTQADFSANQWARFSGMLKITVVVCAVFMINSLALILM